MALNQNPPIFIGAPIRSGTTMIAWLLHLHGVWIGKANVTRAPGTNPLVGTENTEIKNYLKSLNGRDIPESFREDILKLVYTEGPWLVKTAQLLLKSHGLLKAFPDAKWVLPYRNLEQIVDSAMKHPGAKGGRDHRESVAKRHRQLQHRVAEHARYSLWVDSQALALGDTAVAERLFRFCGVEFDLDTYVNWVDPNLWHERDGTS